MREEKSPLGRLCRPLLFIAGLIALGAVLGVLFGLFAPIKQLPSLPPAPPKTESPSSRLTDDPEKPYLLEERPPYTIAIDPGHGGIDNGAEGIIDELDLCEGTADALFALLDADPHFQPVRTRENGQDPKNSARIQTVDNAMASALISIHANSDASSSHGFECFPTPPGRAYSEESMRLAQCIAAEMQAEGHRLRGENGIRFAYYYGSSKRIVDSTDTRARSQKSFGILEKAHCPAVLVEQCFITNSSDTADWAGKDGYQKAAAVYYRALCSYFGVEAQPLTD